MIITKWRLFNFKSVRDDTEIELKPLTIFAGSNSSGKSTVLQSMLLISQTLWSRDNSKPVILNGRFTRLGQFDDLRSFDSEANQILIGWQLENLDAQSDGPVEKVERIFGDLWVDGIPGFDEGVINEEKGIIGELNKRNPPTINCNISFEADPSGEGNISQLQPRLFSCEITVTRKEKGHLRNRRSALLNRISVRWRSDSEIISLDRELGIYNNFTIFGAELAFHVEMEDDDNTNNHILGCVFQHFLPFGLYTFPEDEASGYAGLQLYGFSHYDYGISGIQEFFINEIKYLGPLRDEPKSLYPLMPSVNDKDIGLRGEFTAAVLDLHKSAQIQYISTASFKSPAVSNIWTEEMLESAVTDWLGYLDVAESVKTFDRGKIGHEMKVYMQGSSMAHDLTHVGVGVSQVLPILVMCLLAKPNTVMLIEQPELHLHPKVQTRLADFFLSMAMLGKQCIIETHSEYIINRLRFRTAAAKAETVASLMKVYFVEKIKGNSVFRPVEINKYGAIIDWPDGFFDQSQDEAEQILRFATQKRKQENGGAHHAQRNN